jgi:hypothetical protein
MRTINLTFLVLGLNAAIDQGKTTTLAKAKEHIQTGDVFDWLNAEFSVDTSLVRGRPEGLEIVQGLQAILGGYDGKERRKWGVENNGLALLLAWINELIQQRALAEA